MAVVSCQSVKLLASPRLASPRVPHPEARPARCIPVAGAPTEHSAEVEWGAGIPAKWDRDVPALLGMGFGLSFGGRPALPLRDYPRIIEIPPPLLDIF